MMALYVVVCSENSLIKDKLALLVPDEEIEHVDPCVERVFVRGQNVVRAVQCDNVHHKSTVGYLQSSTAGGLRGAISARRLSDVWKLTAN